METDAIQGYRLSPQQKRLWRLQQRDGDRTYRVSSVMEIEGALDEQILRQAVDGVIVRHEILRTTFRLLPGMTIPVQVIADEGQLSWATRDLTSLSPTEATAEIDQVRRELAESPVDWASIPLLSAALLRLEARRHLLLIAAPALVIDSHSPAQMVTVIGRAYAALKGLRKADSAPEMQYADFAEWQNELIESDAAKIADRFWKQFDLRQIEGQSILFDVTQEAEPYQPAVLPIEIPAEVMKQLQMMATATRPVSLIVHGCWQVVADSLLLSPNDAGATIGVLFDGRKFAELEGAIGAISAYLPVRAELNSAGRFDELLSQLKEQSEEAARRQEYFYRALDDDASPSYFPLCFEALPAVRFKTDGGFRVWLNDLNGCTDRFKLKLVYRESKENPAIELQYDAGAFSEANARLIAGRMEVALAAARPEARVADLQLAGPEEQQRLASFNHTAQDFPAGQSIHQLFEAQAARHPDRAAVVCEGESLTFAELNARANQLARHLRDVGVTADAAVGLCLERSVDLIVGLVGILKAGGAYLPLDPGQPAARLETMLAEAGARVLVTRDEIAHAWRDSVDQVVLLEAGNDLLAAKETANPNFEISDQNLAYIIFTSGSTGIPKGVAVEHRQLVNYLHGVTQRLELPDEGSFAMVSTIAADLGNTALLPSLCGGRTLHLIAEERATNPDALSEYFQRHAIDCLKIVPSHLAALLSAAHPAEVLPRQRLVLGGEGCPRRLVQRIAELSPDCVIFNHYGPTEATVGITTNRIDAKKIDSGPEVISLGRPIANAQVFILDKQLRLAPIGVAGELYLGGAGLARGYVNRPEVTAEKFVPHPFGEAGARLYRTGDRGRFLPDGRIEFLGRVDDQVKIHGYRIEPGEIERLLAMDPRVAAAVVVAREDQPGEKRLVAYVVPQADQAVESRALKIFLSERLPDYMVPANIVSLERLPLTPNGKIDRRALPAPARRDDERAFRESQNATEETLARIWAEVLGIDRISTDANFFELGGDSILSIQIIARANQAGLQLSPRQLFEHQTITELSAVAGTAARVVAQQGPVTGAAPLTPVQRRFFMQEQPEPQHYNQATMLEVDQSLDPEILRRALEQLAIHHDALRLRFQRESDGWHQQIDNAESPAVQFEIVDLSRVATDELSSAIESRASEAQAGLDLVQGPLLRAVLFEAGEHRYLLLVIHHLAVDGVSWTVLLEDLAKLCLDLTQGAAPQLPPKTTSWKDWAERLMRHARSDKLRQELDYWLALTGTDVAGLPIDTAVAPTRRREVNIGASARSVTVSLDAEETRALLQDAPAAYRTQINEVLLTALAFTLHWWTGSKQSLVDLEGHGREDLFPDTDLSRTVGWFTTIFPVSLTSAPTLIETLKLVKEQLRAIPHHGIGYGMLRFGSGDRTITAQLNSQPQAEIRFNYLGRLDRAVPEDALLRPATQPCGSLQSPRTVRGYLLNVIGAVNEGRLRIEWTYSEMIHHRATVTRLARRYLDDLRSLISDAKSAAAASYTPSDFPRAKVSQEDLRRILSRLGSQSE